MDAVHAEGWRGVLARCAAALARVDGAAWLTGGSVRDALRGRAPRDLDLTVTADPWALARLLAPSGTPGAAVIPLRETHGTVRVALLLADTNGTAQIDLSPLRGGSLHTDLKTRDFTMNAMAWPLTAYGAFVALLAERSPDAARDTTALADPLGGLASLRAGQLRAASATALVDDPVRVLRGARLAAELDLAPDVATLAQMRAAAPALAHEPVERVRDELWGILALSEPERAARGLALLHAAGTLSVVLPELAAALAGEDGDPESGATSAHAIQTVAALAAARNAIVAHAPAGRLADLHAWLDGWESQPLAAGRPRRLALRWAALLHQLGSGAHGTSSMPEGGQEVFKRMGLARPERTLARMVGWHLHEVRHLFEDSASDVSGADDLLAARRFFAATGDAGIETLLVATACALSPPSRAGKGTGGLGLAARWVARFAWEHATVVPPSLVDGPALIAALRIAPGPEVGRLLAAIRQAQIEGAIERADQALALARTLLAG